MFLSMQRQSIQSMGGQARAKALSANERSEIARNAAEHKWSLPKAKWGSPDKTLKIGDRELECYVLEDGTRVLSGRGMQEVLGLGQSHGALLKEFVTHNNIKPFIDNELAMELDSPLRFIRPGRGGIPAVAFEATILPKVCDAVLEARKRNPKLTKRQADIADQCETITRVLSKVGIIALVDEVTGYQYDRTRTALAEILEKFIAKELQGWTRTFPTEFYEQIFRLKNWKFDPKSVKRPQVIGHYTTDIVYRRLAPGVVDELKRLSPKVDGRRKNKLFQWLTGDIGHPKLRSHLDGVLALMKASDNWLQFRQFLKKAFPKFEKTELGFEIETLEKN